MTGFHLSCGTCRTLFCGFCILHCADFEMLQSILRNKSLHRRWFNVLLWKLQQIINELGFSGVMLKFCHLILLETIAGPKTIEGGIFQRNWAMACWPHSHEDFDRTDYAKVTVPIICLRKVSSILFIVYFLSDFVLSCCGFSVFRVYQVLIAYVRSEYRELYVNLCFWGWKP